MVQDGLSGTYFLKTFLVIKLHFVNLLFNKECCSREPSLLCSPDLSMPPCCIREALTAHVAHPHRDLHSDSQAPQTYHVPNWDHHLPFQISPPPIPTAGDGTAMCHFAVAKARSQNFLTYHSPQDVEGQGTLQTFTWTWLVIGSPPGLAFCSIRPLFRSLEVVCLSHPRTLTQDDLGSQVPSVQNIFLLFFFSLATLMHPAVSTKYYFIEKTFSDHEPRCIQGSQAISEDPSP